MLYSFNIRFPFLLISIIKYIATRKDYKSINFHYSTMIQHTKTLTFISSMYKTIYFIFENNTKFKESTNILLAGTIASVVGRLYLKNNNKSVKDMTLYTLSYNLTYLVHMIGTRYYDKNTQVFNINHNNGITFYSVLSTIFVIYFSYTDNNKVMSPELKYLYHHNKGDVDHYVYIAILAAMLIFYNK